MSPAFVGFIIVPLVGAAAEMAVAFSAARKDRLDMSVSIARLGVPPRFQRGGKLCPKNTPRPRREIGNRADPRELGASLQKDRGGIIQEAINFEAPGAAQRARMLCGIFSLISLPRSGYLRQRVN